MAARTRLSIRSARLAGEGGRWGWSVSKMRAVDGALRRPSRSAGLYGRTQRQTEAPEGVFSRDAGPGSRLGACGVDRRITLAIADPPHIADHSRAACRSGALSPVARLRGGHG